LVLWVLLLALALAFVVVELAALMVHRPNIQIAIGIHQNIAESGRIRLLFCLYRPSSTII
jgi:hypothetical protein